MISIFHMYVIINIVCMCNDIDIYSCLSAVRLYARAAEVGRDITGCQTRVVRPSTHHITSLYHKPQYSPAYTHVL